MHRRARCRRCPPTARPLQGVRVLDLTRILAGPVGARALAAHGADVLLVNSPHLPNIEAIADTSRGKLSAHADLRDRPAAAAFDAVLRDAHVFVQGYRPGGLQQLGYGAEALAERHPGIVVVSLSAYGSSGPWAGPPRLRFAGADGHRLQPCRGAGLRQRRGRARCRCRSSTMPPAT